jgi:hypothetical protein
MSISYEEALSTLQSMFSDQGYTPRHLDAVLRHHGGHMENTVETLLMHGDGTPDELMGKLSRTAADGVASSYSSGGTGGQRGFDVDADVARRLAAEDGMHTRRHGEFGPSSTGADASRAARSSGTRGTRGTPAELPSDFLRIPGRKYPASTTTTSSASSSSSSGFSIASSSSGSAMAGGGIAGQVMTDEQLARMLQDELFQEEIRNNPEFSHLAGRRNPRATTHASWGAGWTGPGGQTTGRSNYGGAGGVVSNDILEGFSSECFWSSISSSRGDNDIQPPHDILSPSKSFAIYFPPSI